MINIPCWQMNKKCSVRGMSKEESHCPAYKTNKSCYELDWGSFVKGLSDDEKKYWKVHMSKCKNCNVYKVYKKDMDKAIAEVKKA